MSKYKQNARAGGQGSHCRGEPLRSSNDAPSMALVQRNLDVQEQQLTNQRYFPDTGKNGIPDPDQLLTKALASMSSDELIHLPQQDSAGTENDQVQEDTTASCQAKSSSPTKEGKRAGASKDPLDSKEVDEAEEAQAAEGDSGQPSPVRAALPGQAPYAGKNCKGSLKRAFQDKQPWSYKLDLFKNAEKRTQDVNLLDNKSLVDLRRQVIDQGRRERDTRQPHTAEETVAEVDSNNKTCDELRLKIEEMRDDGSPPQLLPSAGPLAPSASVGHTPSRRAHPRSLVSFKHFYNLQNQKLELQKQNLVNLQTLQKEKQRYQVMHFTGDDDQDARSMQQKDLERMKAQCDAVQGYNAEAVKVMDQRHQSLEKVKIRASFAKFDAKNQVDVDQFRKISAPFRQRVVLCKTGYDFFKHSNSIKSNDLGFSTTTGGDVVKSLNTAAPWGGRAPKALNPLKLPGSMKLKKALMLNSTQDPLPKAGAELQGHYLDLGEGTGTATASPTSKQKGAIGSTFRKQLSPTYEGDARLQRIPAAYHTIDAGMDHAKDRGAPDLRALSSSLELPSPARWKQTLQMQTQGRSSRASPFLAPLGPPPLLHHFSPEVRVSSNKKDTDIDAIMKILMTNRIAHLQFDPVLSHKSTRDYVKGLVFQSSELAPYSKYVNSPDMANLISQRLSAPSLIDSINMPLSARQASQEPTKAGQQARQSRNLLPFHIGANKKDFQRAKWLAEELSAPGGRGSPSGNHQKAKKNQKSGQEEAEDPEAVQERQTATEKLKEQEQFEDRVVQIFDPLSLLSKETSRLTASRQGRVYDIQVAHTARLMQKSSNRQINGLPDYLDSLRYRDEGKPKRVAAQIRDNTFDYKGEQQRLKKLVESVKRFGRVGGPVQRDLMDGYPGDKEFIKHLEATTEFRYRTYAPKPEKRHHRAPLFASRDDDKGRRPSESLRRGGSKSLPSSGAHPDQAEEGEVGETQQDDVQRRMVQEDTSIEAPDEESYGAESPRSRCEELEEENSAGKKNAEEVLKVDDTDGQASSQAHSPPRKPLPAARENRSGGNLSRNYLYSELGPLDAHVCAENATVDEDRQHEQGEHQIKAPRNPFVKQNGVMSEHDFVVGTKGRQHGRQFKLSQIPTAQQTEDPSVEHQALNTKRTELQHFSFGVDSTKLGGGTAVNEQSKQSQASELMGLGGQSHMNETFLVERGLPGQNLGDLEGSYASGGTLDVHPLRSSLLSARDDGVAGDLAKNATVKLVGSTSAANEIGQGDSGIGISSPGIKQGKIRIELESPKVPGDEARKAARKKQLSLTQRVKRIKEHFETSLPSPPGKDTLTLQKYMKKKRRQDEIYEDQQIKAIMDDEWLQILARAWKGHPSEGQVPPFAFEQPRLEGSEPGAPELSPQRRNRSHLPEPPAGLGVGALAAQPQTLGGRDEKARARLAGQQEVRLDQTFASSRGPTEVDTSSWVSSPTKHGTSAKALGARIANFIDMLDSTNKNARPAAQLKEFDSIQKLMKENKMIRRGIAGYLEMMTSNPNQTDMANTVEDFIEDRATMKALFKHNLKDPDNIKRMKRDNFTCSLKIAGYGRRDLWMPDKVSFKPPERRRKPPLVRFDKDGHAYYPDQ